MNVAFPFLCFSTHVTSVKHGFISAGRLLWAKGCLRVPWPCSNMADLKGSLVWLLPQVRVPKQSLRQGLVCSLLTEGMSLGNTLEGAWKQARRNKCAEEGCGLS